VVFSGTKRIITVCEHFREVEKAEKVLQSVEEDTDFQVTETTTPKSSPTSTTSGSPLHRSNTDTPAGKRFLPTSSSDGGGDSDGEDEEIRPSNKPRSMQRPQRNPGRDRMTSLEDTSLPRQQRLVTDDDTAITIHSDSSDNDFAPDEATNVAGDDDNDNEDNDDL
jgi:hypothetical protein